MIDGGVAAVRLPRPRLITHAHREAPNQSQRVHGTRRRAKIMAKMQNCAVPCRVRVQRKADLRIGPLIGVKNGKSRLHFSNQFSLSLSHTFFMWRGAVECRGAGGHPGGWSAGLRSLVCELVSRTQVTTTTVVSHSLDSFSSHSQSGDTLTQGIQLEYGHHWVQP